MLDEIKNKISTIVDENKENEIVVVRNNHNVTRVGGQSYKGFIHELTYKDSKNKTYQVRISKYDGKMDWKTQFEKKHKDAKIIGRKAIYNERGIFNPVCKFKCENILFNGKEIILNDGNFSYHMSMFNRNTDIWIINGEPISLFDGETYDVETHNANLNRTTSNRKALAEEIKNDDNLTDAEKLEKLMKLM